MVGLCLILFGLACVAASVFDGKRLMANPNAAPMKVSEFSKRDSRVERVQLMDCKVDIENCTYQSTNRDKKVVVTAVFLPLVSKESETNRGSSVVFKTKRFNDSLTARFNRNSTSAYQPQATFPPSMLKKLETMQSFSGWVQEPRPEIRRKIRGVQPGYMLVNGDLRENWFQVVTGGFLGLGLTLLGVFLVARKLRVKDYTPSS